MWGIDSVFELYQSASNLTVTNETSSQHSISGHVLIIWIFLGSVCLILLLCIIRTVLRRREKKSEKKKLKSIKNIQSTTNDNESVLSDASSQSGASTQ